MGETNKRRTSLYYDADTFMRLVDEWRKGPGEREDGSMPSRNEAIILMVEKTAKQDLNKKHK